MNEGPCVHDLNSLFIALLYINIDSANLSFKQYILAWLDPKGTSFPKNNKKKSNIYKKITSIFPMTQVKSIIGN